MDIDPGTLQRSIFVVAVSAAQPDLVLPEPLSKMTTNRLIVIGAPSLQLIFRGHWERSFRKV